MNNTKSKKSRVSSNGQQSSYRLSRTQYGSNRYQQSNNNSQNQPTFTPSSGMVGGTVPLSGNGSINGNNHGNDVVPRKAVYASAPFLSVVGTQLGNLVQIQTRSGTLWEGILKTFSPEFDIVIEIAAQLDASRKFNIAESITDVMIFKACDIVNIVAKNFDFKEVNGAALLTDSEISRFNGQVRTTVRELEPWIDPEKANGVETDMYLEDEAERGWDAEKMFKRNEEIGVENDFDEDMPGYMVTIDRKDTEEFKREEDIATKIVAKLENNSNSYHNKVNIDNTDEEEEFAAVARPPPTNMKYMLNNGTSNSVEKNFQPPRRVTYNSVNNKTSLRNAASVSSQQVPPAKFETKAAPKYVYNTSNSNYNQQSQHIGSDNYKPLLLRPSSTFHNKSNMTPASLTKTSVSPPLPATQTHQHKNQHRRLSPPNSETSTDDSKSSSVSTSSPPQRNSSALRVHTTSIDVISNSVSINVNANIYDSKPESDERKISKSASMSLSFVSPSSKQRTEQAEESKKSNIQSKSRQNHETVQVQLLVEDPKKDDVGTKLTEGSHALSLQSPTLPSIHPNDKKKSAEIEDSNILKSSNLNPNAKEFVFKSMPVPIPATVSGTTETSVQPVVSPSMVGLGQRTVPVPSVSQSSSSDLSRPQSPTPITHILPIAAPMQQLVALPPQAHHHQAHGHGHGHSQLHPQQHVPYVINSAQPNIYFTTQPIYPSVMSQPQQQPHPSNPNVSNSQHFSKPRGNKGHHNIRDNNMSAVAATGQPLVVSPASVPQYIYQQPAGIQGQCFAPFQAIRMCPQESGPIQQMQYFPSPPPMHPSQQSTQSAATPLQQQVQHFNGMTTTSQGPMFPENYQPSPIHHHTMPPSLNNQVPQPLPPSQHYSQIYSLYPSGGHMVPAPNTVQYITSAPGPVPGSGHNPNHTHAQFPMLIHSTSSTPPMPGPGPGA